MSEEEHKLDVAIVGGGIVGAMLALGLVKRQVNVKIYEKAQSFREIGAGVAFAPNAVRSMMGLDPRIVTAVKTAAGTLDQPDARNTSFRWTEGYQQDPRDGDEGLFMKLDISGGGFEGCHRAQLLDELVKLIPEDLVTFRKNIDTVVDQGEGKKLVLKFQDGTTAEADAVIGCDGIHSRVRQLMFGEDNPVSHPSYSNMYAFRGLIPMAKAVDTLGEHKATNQHLYMGPNKHVLTFPVAKGALMNVVAFVSDPNDWSEEKLTAPARKADVIESYAGWGPAVCAIADLLSENLDKWAIFDTLDHPAPTYAHGRVCIAGDAAHASTPHHGGGGGIGVEDALALAGLLEAAQNTLQAKIASKTPILQAAFEAYGAVRRERSQWFVDSSRFMGDLIEWRNPHTGRDLEKCFSETKTRFHKVWDHDERAMVREAVEYYQKQLQT